eukprot:comp24334_c8_seq11/m.46094 comp24334_c8_seq11/g.46094  ORF comp24334_c8_seq11/g.46094 comp24334_c8_seq11/m.46094 type:complete len:106 (-) comp24334_c8_seq11:32-349(-)
MSGGTLQFVPFTSGVDVGFWHQLAKRKLNLYRLDDSAREIQGYYMAGTHQDVPARLCLSDDSFSEGGQLPPHVVRVCGRMHLANQLQHFKDFDKRRMLDSQGQAV